MICPISGGEPRLMGEPVDLMVGHRLVRFSCQGCLGRFFANPHAYFGMLPAPTTR
jgi:hypothetical protein